MRILQSGHFSRSAKKLHRQEKQLLDDAIKALIENPEVGDVKTGDLSGVCVYKFRVNMDMMLLAYKHDREAHALTLLAYWSHENFYRDMKNFI